MKNRILTLVFLAITAITYAQTTFSSKSVELCIWNDKYENFNDCYGSQFDNSVFVLNENEDMLIHKTSEMTSTYYITNTESEEDFVTYNATSDIGNEYIIMFDIEKRLIKFMGVDEDGTMYLLMYGIKAVF